MTVRIPCVVDDRCRLHDPGGEVWVGVRGPTTEVPEREARIRSALAAAGAPLVPARESGLGPALAVHDEGLVRYLATIWDEWLASGLVDDPGQDRVVPYLFATPGLLAGVAPHEPRAVWARPGRWCFDTMTLIGPGTWDAVQGAVACAVTAADLVADGTPATYALTRPPGHHVTRDAHGGSCYLNNAAIAAARLRSRGAARVALLDIDAHHGNGAQAIFWDDPRVLTGSVHVDPAAGWFPHVLGWPEEVGGEGAVGTNLNLPLAPGSGDAPWLAALDRLVTFADDCDVLVVALGVDASQDDPESPLAVSSDGFRAAGRILAGHGAPVVVVQEGGYDLKQLGALVCSVLEGLPAGATPVVSGRAT